MMGYNLHHPWRPGGAIGSLSRPTVDRKIFLVDGFAWRYCGVTGFQLMDLFSQGKDVDPFLDLYVGLGYNTFRVMANKPEVPGQYPGWNTPPLQTMLDFTHHSASRGARIEHTLFGSQVDSSFVPSWIEALKSECPNAFAEGINEPGHAGQWPDTSHVDSLVMPVRGDLPYATGDYTYDTSKPHGSYGTIHTDRDDPCNTARKAKGVLDMQDIAKIPWVGDEPAKPQDISYRADCFLALFAIYGLFGAGGTFHTLGGQFGQLPNDQELACAKAAIQGLTAFPASTPNDYGYVHDTNDEATSGSLRTYRAGPYGVRVCPNPGYPILIGV
jgi:hypothetical protein